MSSIINDKEFTCLGCGGNDIHEVGTGWCRVISKVKSLQSDGNCWEDEECELLECHFDGNDEQTYVCADCGRELDPEAYEEDDDEADDEQIST